MKKGGRGGEGDKRLWLFKILITLHTIRGGLENLGVCLGLFIFVQSTRHFESLKLKYLATRGTLVLDAPKKKNFFFLEGGEMGCSST